MYIHVYMLISVLSSVLSKRYVDATPVVHFDISCITFIENDCFLTNLITKNDPTQECKILI